MIIVKIIGGLGNQLFQYALGKHLAVKHNTELKFDISDFKNYKLRTFELSNFNININIATQKDLPCKKKNPQVNKYKAWIYDAIFSEIKIKKEISFHFDPRVLKYPDNLYLDGYWQSEKYFKPVERIIKDDLTFSNILSNEQNDLLNLINNSNSISLHIRRGDYIDNKQNHQIYSVCSIDYYQASIEKILQIVEDPFFFIFSDDIEWVKNNLKIPHKYFLVSGNESWVDLKLMSHCKNHIIANSTFSWWGAYLGNSDKKNVISPKSWFTENMGYNTSDLLPVNWITI